MTEVAHIALENETDILLAHKCTSSLGQHFGQSFSLRTTLATAVAEACRVVTSHTDKGLLRIGVTPATGNFFLTAVISFPADSGVGPADEGLQFAQQLVSNFSYDQNTRAAITTITIGDSPPEKNITAAAVLAAVEHFRRSPTTSPHTRLLNEKKDQFISVASHEIRTPLTTIMAFTRLALNATDAGACPKTRRYLEKLDGQVIKLHLLTQQLLDTSWLDEGRLRYNFRATEWTGYLKETLPILELLAPSHKLSCHPTAEQTIVAIDTHRIQQVFTHLINNAVKYSEAETHIDIRCTTDKTHLTVCVCDEGIGISPDNKHRLFEKYFRENAVAGKYSGFGMGLYISSGIITEHKGSIRAEKNEGPGSSFYFTLPLHRA